MAEFQGLQPARTPQVRRRLPKRSKPKQRHVEGTETFRNSAVQNEIGKSTLSFWRECTLTYVRPVNIFKVAIPGISNADDKSDLPEPLESRTFEFVTITSQPSTMSQNGTSKQVRTQAMRDYLRKQNKEAITGVPEIVSAVTLEKPSQYKGRFKLNTWTHKAKKKSTNSRKTKSQNVEMLELEVPSQALVTQGASVGLEDQTWQGINAGQFPNSVVSINRRLDPFDTLAIQLGPHSEKILTHCQSPYLNSGFIRNQLPPLTSPLPLLRFWLAHADISRRLRYDYLHHEFCRSQRGKKFLVLRPSRPRVVPFYSLLSCTSF